MDTIIEKLISRTKSKIYLIHKELSKTEKLISRTQEALDKIAENPDKQNSQKNYKVLNNILHACLLARGDLHKQLQSMHQIRHAKLSFFGRIIKKTTKTTNINF